MIGINDLLKRLSAVSLAVACAGVQAGEVVPGDGANADSPLTLDPLVVVAGKSPRPLSEVAAQVTVIDIEVIQSGMVEDLDGLLKYQPGIDLETEGTRFSAGGINIRGIGGNRVAIEIDGVPVRDSFVIGAYSNGGRELLEADRIKRVEILYGPASVMYGSDALGGVVSISTWDPDDLLAGAERDNWLGARAGYQSSDQSWVGSAVAAWGQGAHGLLAAATYRDGHELDSQAASDIPKDQQDWNSSDFMFRYAYDTASGNRFRFSAEQGKREVASDNQSQLGYGRRFRNTTALTGDDQDESRRLSMDYDFVFGNWQPGTLRVYDVRQSTDQLTFEERAKGPAPVDIMRRFYYRQHLSGIELNLFREVVWGGNVHRFGLGGEWKLKNISELRDGLQTSLIDGSTTPFILGEEMPVRDFPISDTSEFGLYLQDEISLAGGRWEIIPGLRWDRYKLDPKPDEIWLEDNPGTAVVSITETQVTPRLGVVFHVAEDWTLYGQYAGGFRAPPFEDANIGFELPLFGFRAIPNPDLKSETSDGLEFGVRHITPTSRITLAGFHTDYDDFIESRALIGRNPATGETLFQSRNIDQARIYGFDVRYDQDLSAWSGSMEGWMLNVAAYWAKGENRQTDQPLNTISPPQAVLGLSWTSSDASWDVGFNGTFTAAKKASDIDSSEQDLFATPSWITFDITASWRPTPGFEIRAGLFNLGNKTYWRWLDTYKREADDPMVAMLSRPGRNFSITTRFSF